MSADFRQFKSECETELRGERSFQFYLLACSPDIREAVAGMMLSAYIKGRLDEAATPKLRGPW